MRLRYHCCAGPADAPLSDQDAARVSLGNTFVVINCLQAKLRISYAFFGFYCVDIADDHGISYSAIHSNCHQQRDRDVYDVTVVVIDTNSFVHSDSHWYRHTVSHRDTVGVANPDKQSLRDIDWQRNPFSGPDIFPQHQ